MSVDVSDTQTGAAEELPAFLAGGEEQDVVTDDVEPHPIAAE